MEKLAQRSLVHGRHLDRPGHLPDPPLPPQQLEDGPEVWSHLAGLVLRAHHPGLSVRVSD